MKNDLATGGGDRMPEKIIIDTPEISRRRGIVSIALRFLRLFVGGKGSSQSFEFRYRKTKSDGSSSETEFKYQKKDETGNS